MSIKATNQVFIFGHFYNSLSELILDVFKYVVYSRLARPVLEIKFNPE